MTTRAGWTTTDRTPSGATAGLDTPRRQGPPRIHLPRFIRAFAFITGVALRGEAMGHQPEWFNVYNRVVVDLMTHDAQGMTQLDFELADRMQLLAAGG